VVFATAKSSSFPSAEIETRITTVPASLLRRAENGNGGYGVLQEPGTIDILLSVAENAWSENSNAVPVTSAMQTCHHLCCKRIALSSNPLPRA